MSEPREKPEGRKVRSNFSENFSETPEADQLDRMTTDEVIAAAKALAPPVEPERAATTPREVRVAAQQGEHDEWARPAPPVEQREQEGRWGLWRCPECGFGYVSPFDVEEAGRAGWEFCTGKPWGDDRPLHREVKFERIEVVPAAKAAPSWIGCPDAEVCKSCPCASEDDVCFPGERLRAELRAARARVSDLEGTIRHHQQEPDMVEAPMDGGEGMVLASNRHAKDARLYGVIPEGEDPADPNQRH